MRAANRRRRTHERQAADRTRNKPLDEIGLREAQAVIDEELAALAERYRAPVLLCYLEGTTRDEVARQLGWSLATLKRRLTQGRELLRRAGSLSFVVRLQSIGLPPCPATVRLGGKLPAILGAEHGGE